MSICCSTACLDCREHAPEVGYAGYLGTPSLSTVPSPDDPEEHPFGYLYEPLERLGLRTYDLEAFKAFLKSHDGHRLYAYSDHDGPLPPELDEMLSSDRSGEPNSEDELLDGEHFTDDAIYELECPRCGETYRSPDEARLRSFDRFDLSEEVIDLYLDRLGSLCPDDGWAYRLDPLVDPFSEFIEHLPDFLKKHRHHRIHSQLVKKS